MRTLRLTRKRGVVLFLLFALFASAVLAAVTSKLTYASNTDLFTAVTVRTDEAGFSNTFIWATDITDRKIDGTYKISRTIYRTRAAETDEQSLPVDLSVGIHEQKGFRHYIVYGSQSEVLIPAGGEIQIRPDSVYTVFNIITRNAEGKEVQNVEFTIGFVGMDGKDYFEDGSGTQNDPFIISSAQQLDNMRFFLGSNFKLSADIDLTNYYCKTNEINKSPSLNTYWRGIGISEVYAFRGRIDGNGKSILGLNLLDDSFFKYITNAEVTNLKIINASVNANTAVGAIFATNLKDTILKNITLEGHIIHNQNAAGLAVNAKYSFVQSALKEDRTVVDGLSITLSFQTPRAQNEYKRIAGAFLDLSGEANLSAEDDRRPILKNISVSQPVNQSGEITQPPINASDNSAGIAGKASNVVLENTGFKGNFNLGASGNVGGIAGTASSVLIGDNCSAEVNIYNTLGSIGSNYGLMVGQSTDMLVLGSEVSVKGGIQKGLATGGNSMGGVVGLTGGLVIGSQFEANIDAVVGQQNVGGLAGNTSGSVTIGEESIIFISSVEGSGANLGGLIGVSGTATAVNLTIGSSSKIVVSEVLCTGSGNGIGGLASNLSGLFTVEKGTITNNTVIEVGTVKSAAGNNTGGVIGLLTGGASIQNNTKIMVGQVITASGQLIGGFVGDFNSNATVEFLIENAGKTPQEIQSTPTDKKAYFSVSNIVATNSYSGGFVGRVSGNGTFKNIEYSNVEINGVGNIGGFIGGVVAADTGTLIEDITITNIKVAGSGGGAGGFIGTNIGATCNNIMVQADTTGLNNTGGIFGSNTAAKEFNNITVLSGSKIEGTTSAGGFAGNNNAAAVFNNITVESSVSIAGTGTVGGLIGGFVYGTMKNSTIRRNVTVSASGSTIGGAFGSLGTVATGGGAKVDAITVEYAVVYAGSGIAGGFAGTAAYGGNSGIAEIGLNSPCSVNVDIYNVSGSVGGLIGQMGDRANNIFRLGKNNTVNGTLVSDGMVGGFIGSVGSGILATDIFIDTGNSFTGIIISGTTTNVHGSGGFIGSTNSKDLNALNHLNQKIDFTLYPAGTAGRLGMFSGTGQDKIAGVNGISETSKIFGYSQIRPVVSHTLSEVTNGYNVSFNIDAGLRTGTVFKYQINGDPTTETTISDIGTQTVFAKYGQTVRLLMYFDDESVTRLYYAYAATVPAATPLVSGTIDPENVDFTVVKNYSGTWAHKQIAFSLSHNPELSGLKYQYSLNGGQWTDTSHSLFIVSASVLGASYQFRLVNPLVSPTDSGYVLATSDEFVVNIDLTRPTISAKVEEGAEYQDEVLVTITLTTIPFSGIDNLTIYYGGEPVYTTPELVIKDTTTRTAQAYLSKNGRYTAVLTDGAGREIACEFSVTKIIQEILPDFEVYGNPEDQNYYTSVNLTLPVFNNSFAVKYTLNNGKMTDITATYPNFTATKNGTYAFYIVMAGDVYIKSKEVEITCIDESIPDLIISYDSSEWYQNAAAVYINVNNIGVSGVESIKLYYNDVYLQDVTDLSVYYASQRGDYRFELTSGAGAVVVRTLSILNLDINNYITLTGKVTEGVTGIWSDEGIKIELTAKGDMGEITSPVKYYYSVDSGENWILTDRVFYVRQNMHEVLTYMAQTAAGLDDECNTDQNGNPFEIMLDIEAPKMKILYDWINPDIDEGITGSATFTVFATNNISGVRLEWSDDASTWRTDDCIEGEDNIWTKSFDIQQEEKTYYFRLITLGTGKHSLVETVIVAADTSVPSIDIEIDVIGGSKFELWCPSFTFYFSVSQMPISGITYQYRVTSLPGGQGQEIVKWTAVDGDELTVTNTVGYFSFKGRSGARIESPIKYVDNIVRTDSLVDMRFVIAGTDESYNDNLDRWYSFLDIDLQFISGSTIFGTMDYPGGSIDIDNVSDILRITQNGTYTFTLRNAAEVERIFSFTVTRIDNTVPRFSVITSGNVGSATAGDVMFVFAPLISIPAGITYYYHTGDGVWMPILDVFGQPRNQIVFNYNIDKSISFMARSSVVNGVEWLLSETFHVIINKNIPTLSVSISDSGATFVIESNFYQLSGKVYMSVNGGDETELTGAVSPVLGEGLYRFRAVSETGVESLVQEINVIFAKIKAVSGGKTYNGKESIERMGRFNKNVEIILQNAAAVYITRGSAPISPNATANSNGLAYKFTKNGTYTVTVVSESGSISTIIFEVSKPNYILIFSISAGALLLIAVISVLIVLQIRNRRAIKRLISATTVSDESNKFIMFKKIK